ncbi:MAG: glycosyl transferase [Acidobacteria bacterium]|nr:MAG: glycosyl transferase [Acidobacteriota bacterium]
MANFEKVSVVLPAMNEGAVIQSVLEKVKTVTKGLSEIIVVDDGSTDNTARIAEACGVKVVRHRYNKGNGAAVKTGAKTATRPFVIFMDADGQHDPVEIEPMIDLLEKNDLVIGARTSDSEGSIHRNIANSIYNGLASYLSEQKILDLTSGFRAFKRPLLLKILFMLPNRFSYPTTSTLAFIKSGFDVGFHPIVAKKRVGKSKIRIFRDGIRFFTIIFKVIIIYSPLKVFLPTSLAFGFLGLLSTLQAVLSQNRLVIPNSAIFLLTTAVNLILLGLVSEQIASMRIEIAERNSEE